jgi:hypothetical protein
MELSLSGIRKDLESHVMRHERFLSSYSLGIRASRTVFDDLLEADQDGERLTREIEQHLKEICGELKALNRHNESMSASQAGH